MFRVKIKNQICVKHLLNGKIHNLEGPAILIADHYLQWFIDGVEYRYEEWRVKSNMILMNEEFNKLLGLKMFKKPLTTTIEELFEESKQFRNYSSYPPSDWEFIVVYLIAEYDVPTAHIILESEHMQWCENKTLKGFMEYISDHLTLAEVTFLIEKHGS